MSSLSTVEARLPPGFRFHPRDEELICDYLMKRVMGFSDHHQSVYNTPPLIEVDLNKCEPWDIPDTACVGGKEWYFYSQRDRKYATGKRTNRATSSGYWKATGKDRPIFRKGGTKLVGMRKTLVFYEGRAPKGTKTDWVMHEFRLEGLHGPGPETIDKEDWVLCRVFYKKMSSTEVSAKQGTRIFEETTSSLSSLLPGILMQPYTTNFEQTDQQASTNINSINAHQYHHQQVSCFSNISATSQTSPTFSPITGDGLLPHDHTSTGDHINPSFNCDSDYKDLNIRASILMHHLNRFETSASFGTGSNSDSYLSEVDLSSMWNNQYS